MMTMMVITDMDVMMTIKLPHTHYMYINTFLHLLKQVRTLTAAGERIRSQWRRVTAPMLKSNTIETLVVAWRI